MAKRLENFWTGVPPCRGPDRHPDGDMSEQVTYQIHKGTLPSTTKRYYRVDEVAIYFSVSDRTIYRLIDMGDLKVVRLRGCIRISTEEIREFEERRRDDY